MVTNRNLDEGVGVGVGVGAAFPAYRRGMARRTDPRAADVIVVGAGAAGSAVTARLLASGHRVLLVEAGRRRSGLLVNMPKGFVRTMADPDLAYMYESHPAGADGAPGRAGGNEDGPVETWLRGKGLGGSTLVNGTMYLRGEPHLYDDLAAELGPDWSWSAFEAAFESVERRLRLPAPGRDADRSAALRALAAGLVRAGAPFTEDVRSGVGPRSGWTPSSIRDGHRVTAFRLISDSTARGMLTVATGRRVVRVLLDGRRTAGVEVLTDQEELVRQHAPQVVLTAGAIETPQILERSGIGDPERLRSVGIEPRIPSPRVGEGLREQRGATVKLRTHDGLGANAGLRGTGLVRSAIRYAARGTGPLATGPYDLVASFDSSGGRRPDLQMLLTEIMTGDDGLSPAPHAGVMAQAFALTPHAIGSVHAAGPDPDAPPELRGPLLGDPRDRAAAARAVEAVRRVLGAPEVDEIAVVEEAPAGMVPAGDDDAAARYVRDTGGAIFHSVGTAAAGGEGAVLDERLRVRGVEGLRAADLSALPFHTSGGTAAVAMALGHLAGGWLDGDLSSRGE